jgi:hypothetical protein
MSSEMLEWIMDALKRQGSSATPLAPSEAKSIVAAAKEKFVQGNPRAWWTSLRVPAKVYNSQDYTLEEILPSQDQSYWFIPETEEDNLSVFDLTGAEVSAVLKECPYFEYYILNKQNQWLIAESDHNRFYVCAGLVNKHA